MRDSIVFYRSFYEAIKEIPIEEQGIVYNAIYGYALDGVMPELTGIAKAIFLLVKPQIDANNERYENGCKGAEYGKKGGRPKKENPIGVSEKTPLVENKNPKETPNENDNENDNEKIHFADFVTMTNAEHDKLVSTYGKEFADQCIKKLDAYKGSKGKKYKNDYRAILSWVVDEVKKNNSNAVKTNAYVNESQAEFQELDRFYL